MEEKPEENRADSAEATSEHSTRERDMFRELVEEHGVEETARMIEILKAQSVKPSIPKGYESLESFPEESSLEFPDPQPSPEPLPAQETADSSPKQKAGFFSRVVSFVGSLLGEIFGCFLLLGMAALLFWGMFSSAISFLLDLFDYLFG